MMIAVPIVVPIGVEVMVTKTTTEVPDSHCKGNDQEVLFGNMTAMGIMREKKE
jgi:hypothetical protein